MPSFGGVAKEAITFVLTGDASGLIKTFGDVEKAADKSLGKTEDSIQKLESSLTKIGAASIGAGLSTALGLTSAIKDFEDTEAAANKLDTAVKGMGSNIDTAKIKDLAFQLQQVSKFTDDQVVAAARWGAVYGLTTDQLSQLLRVAVDLSTQTGKSLDDVTKQLAKVATGGSDTMLKKWGVQFDETALKANSFSETMKAAGDFSAGAAAKSVDTFSGQLTRLHNNFDDIKSQIGAGANEVFKPIVSGAADMAESLAKANPELLKTVGHFTAIGSIGVTAFGGLATAAGQISNIRDAFSGLGDKVKDSEGNLTKLGSTLKGAGIAGAFNAVGARHTEAAFGIRNACNHNEERTKQGIHNDKKPTTDKGATPAYAGLVDTKDTELKWSHLWSDFGNEATVGSKGIVKSVADINAAFNDLGPTDKLRVAKQEIIDANIEIAKAKADAAKPTPIRGDVQAANDARQREAAANALANAQAHK